MSKKRIILPKNYYHAYNRAANKKPIFKNQKDRDFFYGKILEFKAKTGVIIIAYIILFNHYHFLLKEPGREIIKKLKFKGSCQNTISQFLSRLNNSYTQYYNKKYDHSGVIFENEFKSIHVDNDYYLNNLIYYINLNAIKHRLIKNIDNWDYTSHHDYVYYSKKSIVEKDELVDFNEYKSGISNYLKHRKTVEEELGKYI